MKRVERGELLATPPEVRERARELLQRTNCLFPRAPLGEARERQREQIDSRRNFLGQSMPESRFRLGQSEHSSKLSVDKQSAQQQHPCLRICSDAEQLLVVS